MDPEQAREFQRRRNERNGALLLALLGLVLVLYGLSIVKLAAIH